MGEGPLDGPTILCDVGCCSCSDRRPHRSQGRGSAQMVVCAGRKLDKGPSGPRRAGAATAEIFQGFLYIGAVLLFHTRQFPNHDQMASKGRMGPFNFMG